MIRYTVHSDVTDTGRLIEADQLSDSSRVLASNAVVVDSIHVRVKPKINVDIHSSPT